MNHALEVQRLALAQAESRLDALVVPQLVGAGSWLGPTHDLYQRRLTELVALASRAREAVTEARQCLDRALRLELDGGR